MMDRSRPGGGPEPSLRATSGALSLSPGTSQHLPSYLDLGCVSVLGTSPSVAARLPAPVLTPVSNLTQVARERPGIGEGRVAAMSAVLSPKTEHREPSRDEQFGGPLGLLTRSELAQALRVSTRTLDRRRYDDGFPEAVRLLGRPRWRVVDVQGWFERRAMSHAR